MKSAVTKYVFACFWSNLFHQAYTSNKDTWCSLKPV